MANLLDGRVLLLATLKANSLPPTRSQRLAYSGFKSAVIGIFCGYD